MVLCAGIECSAVGLSGVWCVVGVECGDVWSVVECDEIEWCSVVECNIIILEIVLGNT